MTPAQWKTVRPWLPPESPLLAPPSPTTTADSSSPTSPSSSRMSTAARRREDSNYSNAALLSSRLRLEVLDVTSTAVALSVFTPSVPQPSPVSTTSTNAFATRNQPTRQSSPTALKRKTKPSVISIQLDRRPWPHVAHAGSLAGWDGRTGSEITVIIYGLDAGRNYEISLLVIDGEGEETGEESVLDSESVGGEQRFEEENPSINAVHATTLPDSPARSATAPATRPTHTPTNSISTAPTPTSTTPEGPPPPYSAAADIVRPTSPPPDESSLRALLKKIRTSSKRTETVLNASISALRKSVEKGMKEDQRARSRIVSLEDGIRKAKDAELEARESESQECELRIAELVEEEARIKAELDRKRSGKKDSVHIIDVPVVPDEGGEEEDAHEGLGELARELDAINHAIESAEKERRQTAKDALRALEVELGHIEGELIQFDRLEAYQPMMIAGQRSSDSFERYGSPYLPPQEVPPSSGFNLRWRRNNNSNNAPVHSLPPPNADPRSFGRFFRRNDPPQPIAEFVPDLNNTTLKPAFHAQQFAQERQSMWGGVPRVTSTLAPSIRNMMVRRRSGSLNSVPISGEAKFLKRPERERVVSVGAMDNLTSGEEEETAQVEKVATGSTWGRFRALNS